MRELQECNLEITYSITRRHESLSTCVVYLLRIFVVGIAHSSVTSFFQLVSIVTMIRTRRVQSCSPSDEELISHCLYNKLHNRPIIPGNYTVKEFDLYSEEPWDIWNKNGGLELETKNNKGFLYFFTKLNRKTPKSKRFDRRVAGSNGGGWEAEDSPKQITANNCIGFKKRFRYENLNNSEQHGRWIMFEFNLGHPEDLVLCSLKKNVNSKAGRKGWKEHIEPQQPTPSSTTADCNSRAIYDQDSLQNQPLTMSTPAGADKCDDDQVVCSDAIWEFD
ncbi:transcription factor JUNGBRUNNEN 1-like [Tripterygium wilfordii]|uniref:transcription factor JUNGBRUNNEN 1-like n=1 Tax=Tripterygium wilfordii TaxID=458696 RepID=UPI0018F7FCF8|nr:transcription factor JUNGBRUNNEN 1-like [Tripterygium wilfordii]